MLKKIGILNKQGDWLKVWAWIDGPFAIHKTLLEDGLQGETWSITHTASGCSFSTMIQLPKGEVPKSLERLREYRFQGANVFQDAPVCELVEIIPQISAEQGFSDPEILYWTSQFQPLIIKAHQCKE